MIKPNKVTLAVTGRKVPPMLESLGVSEQDVIDLIGVLTPEPQSKTLRKKRAQKLRGEK